MVEADPVPPGNPYGCVHASRHPLKRPRPAILDEQEAPRRVPPPQPL